MMTVNRSKVSSNSTSIIFSVYSSQTPAIKNFKNYCAIVHAMIFFFLIHRFCRADSEPLSLGNSENYIQKSKTSKLENIIAEY